MRLRPRPILHVPLLRDALVRAILPLGLVSLLAAAACTEAGGPTGDPVSFDPPNPSWSEVEIASEEPTAPPTPEPTPARAVELRKAVAAGEVAVTGSGRGLERLDIEVASKTREPLRIVVNPGTVFDAGRSATQAMVVTAKEVIPLEPGATEEVTLEVACSEMRRDQPGSDDTFKVVKRSLPNDLVKLLALEDFPDVEFRIQQFAIWTLLEDPPRSGFVRLGTFGVGTGPSAKEISAIRALFAKAGIDPKGYRATR